MNRKRFFLALLLIALAGNAWAWVQVVASFSKELRVSFLDVGQGDAILIEAPGGTDVLIDGGPDRSVLRQLPRALGLFDRHLDLIIATHPDKDHIAGLVDVFDRYQVSYFLEPGIEKGTSYAEALDAAAASEPGLARFIGRRGMRIHLGKEAYADVLFPDRDVTTVEANDGSIALHIIYGSTSFLMAGDLTDYVEDYIATLDGSALRSGVLKASHHGSRHSTSNAWLAAVDPDIVVVSAGKGNSYGHPAPEVLERVRESGARIISTIDEGTITLISNGREVIGK